jgi:hypothetical protein
MALGSMFTEVILIDLPETGEALAIGLIFGSTTSF